jgi:hypothetical protein
MARGFTLLLLAGMLSCSSPPRHIPTPALTRATELPHLPQNDWSSSLPEGGCSPERLELLVPFYEGLRLVDPGRAMIEAGFSDVELVYPGALSAPFIAWACGDERWSVVASERLEHVPVVFHAKVIGERMALGMHCDAPCGLLQETLDARDWRAAATKLAARWAPKSDLSPLTARFKEIRFFVHDWIDDRPGMSGPPLAVPQARPGATDRIVKTDWELPALVHEMKSVPKAALSFVYGLDPGSVDVGGMPLWSTGAEAAARQIAHSNPSVTQLAWLNLRSYKFSMPKLGVEKSPPPDLEAATRRVDGKTHVYDQYTFRSIEMCLASAAWQASRIQALERLASAGFKVIQLDEFPIPARWDAAPCDATDHLHRPGDLADEWRHIMALVGGIASVARARGITLTTEEPSAALLPYVSGYEDRIFNQDHEIYAAWRKSPHANTIPLFSTMFGQIVTPYTDVDPTATLAPGWIGMKKQGRGR